MLCSCSALYVVDLVKFRETAAGDQLRVFYETLSKDPNSLSNLDQASEEFLLSFYICFVATCKHLDSMRERERDPFLSTYFC